MPQKKSGSPKKRTTGPRIATRLPVQAQGLYTRCVASYDAIKADTVHFATPYPPSAEVDKDIADLGTALSDAASGGPIEMAALHVAETKLRSTWGLVGKYVESVVRAGPIEDAPALIASVLMYESNVGKRAPKPELQARHGANTGVVVLIARAVANAVAYYWEVSQDQVSWSIGAQAGQANATLTGLTPGKLYYFRFHALKRDRSLTDPSQVVSFMVK